MSEASGGGSVTDQLINSAVELPVKIAEVATQDPLSGVLVGVGSMLLALSLGYFGYLSFGGVASLFIPRVSQAPRRRGE